MVKIKKNKVRTEECASDAIDRYFKRKGYRKHRWQKLDAIRDYYINDKDSIECHVTGTIYDLEKEIVEFEFEIIEYPK